MYVKLFLKDSNKSLTLSHLLVLSEFNGTELAFRNIQGVDVTTAAQLNTELLAPGGAPGRLVIFTKNALKKLEDRT